MFVAEFDVPSLSSQRQIEDSEKDMVLKSFKRHACADAIFDFEARRKGRGRDKRLTS